MSTPLFDLGAYEAAGADERAGYEADLDEHLCRSGFLLLTGHGVDLDLVRRTRASAAEFFARPVAAKIGYEPAAAGAPGYYPVASGSLSRTLGEEGLPDLKESFTTGPLLADARGAGGDPALERWFPANRWPEVDGFADIWTAYYRAMDALSNRLLRLFARALDLEPDFFAEFCTNPTSTLSAVHYPGTGEVDSAAQRAGAHSDYGTLTILHKEPGADDLEVLRPGGGWNRMSPDEGVFVVNTGDLLAQWTNDRWVSTVHRVVIPGGVSRRSLSIAFFHQPDADALVEALPSCISEQRPAAYAPVRAGAHLEAKMMRQHEPVAS